MGIPWVFKAILSLLCCYTVIAAGGILGISQDETGEGYFHWSSVAVYDDDTSRLFDDRGFVAVAKAGFEEMLADIASRAQRLPSRSQPFTISAMAVGNEIWFSSPVKGPAFIYNTRARNTINELVASEVSLALQRCQVESHDGETGHRTGAACGEVLCAQQWCSTYKDRDLATQNARVVSFGKFYQAADDSDVGIVDPCDGGPTEWGCRTWLEKVNVRGIRDFLRGEDPGKPPVNPSSTRKPCFWDS